MTKINMCVGVVVHVVFFRKSRIVELHHLQGHDLCSHLFLVVIRLFWRVAECFLATVLIHPIMV